MKANGNAFKRIVLSLLVIVLCVSSAVGATFALFTNGEKGSTVNIVVTAGRVRVDVVDTAGVSLVGSPLSFVCADETREEICWEPGATFYTEGFRVKNIGTVDMNYRLSLSGGNDYVALFDAFEFYVTQEPTAGEDAEKLASFQGSLAVGEEGETYYLVAKMKESAGNAHQTIVLTEIGVTVFAVQGNVAIGE